MNISENFTQIILETFSSKEKDRKEVEFSLRSMTIEKCEIMGCNFTVY